MRILLVESDPELLNQLQEKLTAHHFLVDVASDNETAWGLLHGFVYDLVLLAISSPAIKGISLCQRLREIGNPILIMLLSDTTNPQDYLRGLESGADECLQKPLNWQEFFARIHILARRGIRRVNSILSWGACPIRPRYSTGELSWSVALHQPSRIFITGIISQSTQEKIYSS